MDGLAKQLDVKLHEWEPETANQMRQIISELINLADRGSPRSSNKRIPYSDLAATAKDPDIQREIAFKGKSKMENILP